MNYINHYFKLQVLSDEIKLIHKIKSLHRLDCVSYSGNKNYGGIIPFINHKKQFYLYKSTAKDIVDAHSQRIAEWALTSAGLNFTSLYFEDYEHKNKSYGYPNSKRYLKKGKPNPVAKYGSDGFLFKTDSTCSEIEIFVIEESRNLIGVCYQQFLDGFYDEEIKELRISAIPFFNYTL